MKKIIVLFILILSIFPIYSMISLYINSDVSNEAEEKITALEKDIEMKDTIISDLHNQIELQNGNLLTLSENFEEKELTFQKFVKENDKIIEEYKEIIEAFDSEKTESENNIIYKLAYDNIDFDFEMTEQKIIEFFGEPISETIAIYDSQGFWYLEGLYSKDSVYNDFEIRYHGDKNGENYKMVGLSALSNKLVLDKQFRIGDSVEVLLEAYSWLEEDLWSNEGQGYQYQDMTNMKGIYFKIVDGNIDGINIGIIFD